VVVVVEKVACGRRRMASAYGERERQREEVGAGSEGVKNSEGKGARRSIRRVV